VILGDTSDPRAISPFAQDTDLLVHESTLAHIPLSLGSIAKKTGSHKGTRESVREKAIAKGHSTPDMAGEFAKQINAKILVLNHFSSR
jgi:ribonuclease Z